MLHTIWIGYIIYTPLNIEEYNNIHSPLAVLVTPENSSDPNLFIIKCIAFSYLISIES